jgi:hypothetical protein
LLREDYEKYELLTGQSVYSPSTSTDNDS